MGRAPVGQVRRDARKWRGVGRRGSKGVEEVGRRDDSWERNGGAGDRRSASCLTMRWSRPPQLGWGNCTGLLSSSGGSVRRPAVGGQAAAAHRRR